MESRYAAPFADKAQQSVNYIRIGEYSPFDIVQKHSIVLLDLRIFQILDVVIEDGSKASVYFDIR